MFPFISVAFAEGAVEAVTVATETAIEAVEAAAEVAKKSWFSSVFAKLGSVTPAVWAVVATLAAAGIVLMMLAAKTKWSTRMLANAALTIALSFVLSFIRLHKMPQGGSITLASMLPVFLFAYAYGVGPGVLVGLAYGALQWMQDGFWMLTPVEGVMDYLLAYAVLGLCGLAKLLPEDEDFFLQARLGIGFAIGALARAIVAVAAGAIFFAEYAPEGQAPILYSLGYNGLYLVPDTIICMIIGLPIGKQLLKIMKD